MGSPRSWRTSISAARTAAARRRSDLYTIGHSTRSEEELLALLEAAGAGLVADVRRFPASRRNPQFNREALERWLAGAGIGYRHLPGLGGRRRPVPGSPNAGWREPQFKGYADHMSSAEFATSISELEALAAERPTAVMCAEAPWWRCHRRLIADALTVKGWQVVHLGVGRGSSAHQLTPFAVVERGQLTYPAEQASLFR